MKANKLNSHTMYTVGTGVAIKPFLFDRGNRYGIIS
jgi:hypothetical protein